MNEERRIETHFVFPPIPVRNFDWCAWYTDTDEENQCVGWGKTEEEAIADLEARDSVNRDPQ